MIFVKSNRCEHICELGQHFHDMYLCAYFTGGCKHGSSFAVSRWDWNWCVAWVADWEFFFAPIRTTELGDRLSPLEQEFAQKLALVILLSMSDLYNLTETSPTWCFVNIYDLRYKVSQITRIWTSTQLFLRRKWVVVTNWKSYCYGASTWMPWESTCTILC